MAMIFLRDYAKKHGKTAAAMRIKAERGRFKTAKKFGRDWLIDENEPLIDLRRSNEKEEEK